MQARVVILGIQVDNDELYCKIANQPSDAYPVKPCKLVIIFGMQVDNDILCRGIANQPSYAYSSLYMSDFLSLNTFNDEIFRQRYL